MADTTTTMDTPTNTMGNPTTTKGRINHSSTEHSISDRIDTSNLSGYKYYAAVVANCATTSENVINSVSQAIRPFK